MNDGYPLVSVIIVNYNGKKYLKNCLDSFLKIDYPYYQIILVDNGSRDDNVAFVKQNYPQVKTLDSNHNLGLDVASNKGAEIAKEKGWIMSSDCSLYNKKMPL